MLKSRRDGRKMRKMSGNDSDKTLYSSISDLPAPKMIKVMGHNQTTHTTNPQKRSITSFISTIQFSFINLQWKL